MSNDLILVLGLFFAVLSLPAILSAFTHGRALRGPMMLLLGGMAMIAVAAAQDPNGFDVAEIPDRVVRVMGQYLN